MPTDGRPRWIEELTAESGATYWRSLAELTRSPELLEAARGEFPLGADVADGFSRRGFLKLLGASMALAGVNGCAKAPAEKIMPYTVEPSGTPGVPSFYATSMVRDGFATGVIVASNEGRPTKIEGNPDHPASLGAAGVFEQASVLQLYDPHRSRAIRAEKAATSWERFADLFSGPRPDRGAGLRVLLRPSSSPLVAALIARIVERHPEVRFTFFSPTQADSPIEGSRRAYGRSLATTYDFSSAKVVVALDADPAGMMPFGLRYARQLADRRRLPGASDEMSRIYVAEPRITSTGTIADHRFRSRARDVPGIAADLAIELLALRSAIEVPSAVHVLLARARWQRPWIVAMARDLANSREAGVVVAGSGQPSAVHVLLHLVNTALASRAVSFHHPALIDAGAHSLELSSLVSQMRDGHVDTLVVLDGNPAYDAPADLDFATALEHVKTSVYLGMYENETGCRSSWYLPGTHYLESWGDARAFDGTRSLVQPLISPLFGGHSAVDVLAILAGERHATAHQLLSAEWARGGGDSVGWQRALKRGLVDGTASPAVAPRIDWKSVLSALAELPAPAADGAIELVFRPSQTVYDGSFTNNAWLLEQPEPTTKLTWGNAALVSPATAKRLGIADGDELELTVADRRVKIPALIAPGHADESLSVDLGWGRSGVEALAEGVGADVYPLRRSTTLALAPAVAIRQTGLRTQLARTQTHWSMEGRDAALSTTLAAYRLHPDFTSEHKGPQPSLMPIREQLGNQWAMSIDLSVCTGCSACMLACQAENNVLVVGKEAVLNSREMHWLRIDTYYAGTAEDPRIVTQPMLCQHCEHAPCEYVCPVNATVHSDDGLNEMVYNRCVGTRFCSNNCPYKVRRFNWFRWDERPQNSGLVQLQRNPEVTVRQRGVMEKCTYCVQRIRSTEIHARIEGREIADGEVRTACQQSCPTRAITFGSLSHADSEVVRWRKQARNYEVLHDLGTRPRTQYLAQVKNPNPEID